jgi:hypothetical protein
MLFKTRTWVFLSLVALSPARYAIASAEETVTNPALAPLPAALTSAPPAEAWLPRTLTADEKAQRAATDIFVRSSTQLIGSTPPNIFLLATELVNSQYDLIQAQLDDGLKRYQADRRYEFVVRDMIQFTEGSKMAAASDKYLIDEWEKQRPDSAWAHHNEALYWLNKAWAVRGDGLASTVSDEAETKMHKYLDYARGEIHQALKLEPKDVFGWALLVDVDTTDGRGDEMKRDYQAGVGQDAASFLLAVGYIKALGPLWYGSYAEMDGFAHVQAAKTGLNQRFWMLQGDSAAAKACARCNDYDWVTGLKQYNLALAYGDSDSALRGAGEAAIGLHRYALAGKYFERAARYHSYEFLKTSTELQLMQALCDPKETALKFRALRNDAQSYAGVQVIDYPRSPGDCSYHQAELPWGDEPVPNGGTPMSYDLQMEMMKAKQQQQKN